MVSWALEWDALQGTCASHPTPLPQPGDVSPASAPQPALKRPSLHGSPRGGPALPTYSSESVWEAPRWKVRRPLCTGQGLGPDKDSLRGCSTPSPRALCRQRLPWVGASAHPYPGLGVMSVPSWSKHSPDPVSPPPPSRCPADLGPCQELSLVKVYIFSPTFYFENFQTCTGWKNWPENTQMPTLQTLPLAGCSPCFTAAAPSPSLYPSIWFSFLRAFRGNV